MRKNDILATENATVLDMSMLFTYVLDDIFANDYDMSALYNVIVDSDIDEQHVRDDYIHVYRHNTTYASDKAHNNVFQCYLKHSKKQVCVVCNRTNFDAFSTDNASYVREIKSNSLYRYRVTYDTFIAFMREIIAFDINRQTTSATQENVDVIAK